jgi:hypothetical protein
MFATAGDFYYFNERNGPNGTPREIYKFNPTTGQSTFVSTVATAKRFFAMDRQPVTGTVFAVEPLTSGLYKMDLSTGGTTFVGTITVNTVSAIAFDPTTGVLYAYSQSTGDGLYIIDPTTAAATLVGPIAQLRRALVCSNSGQLYIFNFDGRLYSVDKTTGAGTLIGGGNGGITLVSDATFTNDGKLYATDYDGSIHEVDINTGIETPVGNTGLGQGLLAAVDDGCGSTPYCVAKVNSLGCSPTISGTGTPSATAPNGFIVSCSFVRNQKNGLLFYSVTGPASSPFQNGTLCVAAQIKRTGSQNSGGSPIPNNDCSGVWAIDMNTFAQSPGPPAPLAALKVPGTNVYCQWWGRDPGFPAPNNTQLSNGLFYHVCN